MSRWDSYYNGPSAAEYAADKSEASLRARLSAAPVLTHGEVIERCNALMAEISAEIRTLEAREEYKRAIVLVRMGHNPARCNEPEGALLVQQHERASFAVSTLDKLSQRWGGNGAKLRKGETPRASDAAISMGVIAVPSATVSALEIFALVWEV